LGLEYGFGMDLWGCLCLETREKHHCGIACQNIIAEVIKENNLPEGISCLINGDYKVGEMMTSDKRAIDFSYRFYLYGVL
jgi:hypothetical protein